MTIAEIRGKISRTGENLSERLEDLLTSDVFSACKYVRPTTLLLPFLSKAKQLNNESLEHLIEDNIAQVRYLFWPRLKRSEPDVLITLEFTSGYFFLILIESKYFSQKSSSALSLEELEIAETPSDQLAREYLDLLDAHEAFNYQKSKILGRALIYITAHRSIPKDSLNESKIEIKKFLADKDNVNLFWTNWFELHPIISSAQKIFKWERPILDDLRQLLERKRLIHFKGFNLDMVTNIPDGFVFRGKVARRSTRYIFVLLPETIMTRPLFYLSSPQAREYKWRISENKILGKIYQGGVK